MSPAPSGLKSKPSKKPARSMLSLLAAHVGYNVSQKTSLHAYEVITALIFKLVAF
jgi:hypothetical protein